jgi:hypothetical protein
VATDRAFLTNHLCRFYDFTNKVVLLVGAGGNQLLDHATKFKKLVAIDRNAEALQDLQTKIAASSNAASVEVLASKFEDVMVRGDVVYFEFCLHEITDPLEALEHAKTLAPDIVVFDHSPDSPWVFHAAEEDLVCRSANAMNHFGIRSRVSFRTGQRFCNDNELLDKIRCQGPIAVQRAQRFVGATNILIPMDCELALL